MKYGKYIRKTRKTFRKTSRFAKKARRIRYRKRFERRLNSVAEKKMKYVDKQEGDLIAATVVANLGDGIIKTAWPGVGPGGNERVGTKIFIRYIMLDLWIYNVSDTVRTNGQVGVVVIKERRPASTRGINVSDLFYGGRPILETDLYKDRQVKKIYLKTRHMHYSSTDLPQSIHFKLKFKIMKSSSRDFENSLPDIPDIYVAPVFFTAPFSANGSTGPAKFSSKLTMTYTDV